MSTARNSPQELLAHVAWARRLAAQLLHGPADADDLAQEAWLRSLESAPPPHSALRAWLTGVMRNVRRMEARTAVRRRRREEQAPQAAEGSRPADELLEELEAQRCLAELLLALQEPLRRTVLLRYYEGKSSAEIARQEGVPEGTVRWRLKQGLDELRARLSERYGDRKRWGVALAPLAAAAPSRHTTLGWLATTVPKALALPAAAVLALSLWRAAPAVTALDRAAASQPIHERPPLTKENPMTEIKRNNVQNLKVAAGALAMAIASGATPSRAAAPDVMPGSADVHGSLDKDIIRRIVRRHIKEVKACYEPEQAKTPTLGGRLVVAWTIDADGAVAHAAVDSTTLGNATVENCVVQAVYTWEFPKPLGGGIVKVRYPFVLAPGKK